MKPEGNKHIKILPSLISNIKKAMQIALVVFVFACSSPVVSNRIIVARPALVKLNTNEFDKAVAITTHSGFTKLRCAAAAYISNSTTPVFCITADNDCLVTNASRPQGYDNTGGNPPLHTCYTFVKPLIDREAALAACGGVEEGCCPAPFEQDASMGGCVFTSMWYYHMQSFHVARQFCKSMWSTADLYIKPSTTSAMVVMQYTYTRSFQPGPIWLGARAVPNGSMTYKWVDGSTMSNSDFTFYLGEPDKQSKTGYDGIADCVVIPPPPAPGYVFDEPCWPPLYYVCQIP